MDPRVKPEDDVVGGEALPAIMDRHFGQAERRAGAYSPCRLQQTMGLPAKALEKSGPRIFASLRPG